MIAVEVEEHNEMGGKCGVCGDPWDGPWPHQAPGGMFANGNIVADYEEGSMIDVEVEVTTNHRGYFMYRLCPNNDVTQDPDQDCFDQFVLNTEHGDPHLPITDWGLGWWNTRVQLPVGLTCDQCILQWTYTAGNDWGTCENGTQAVGSGAGSTSGRAGAGPPPTGGPETGLQPAKVCQNN